MKPYDKRSPTERRHSAMMADALEGVELDVLRAVVTADGLPREWAEIARGGGRSTERVHVHMRLDRELVRFFKSMGPGYQERMARVLRAWMHGRLAKVIAGPDTTDLVLRPDDVVARVRGEADAIAEEAAALRKAEQIEKESQERREETEARQIWIEYMQAKLELEAQGGTVRDIPLSMLLGPDE